MIIQNGYIIPRIPSDGHIDEDGHPVKGDVRWGHAIPCQHVLRAMDRKGEANGERATSRSYMVLVELPVFCDRVRLTDIRGREIGEFPVVSAEWMEAVGQTKMML